MYAANAHVVRPAREEDEFALRRLAELDSQRPLTGRILLAEIDGRPAAALSIDEDRTIADPFQRTETLRIVLRLRALGIEAYRRTPVLRDRLLAGLRRPHHAREQAA